MCNIQWNNKDINFLIKTHNNTYFAVDNRYRKSSTTYVIGDIIYSRNLSNSYRLECVASGISASTEPIYSSPAAGQYIQDGTCTWIIDDIKDNGKVGNIILGNILYPGYIQANGALVNDASINYPRLINFLNDNTNLLAVDDTSWNSNKALYVYDSVNDTLKIPDAAGRVLQGGLNIESVEAGLPNITGSNVIVSSGSVHTGTGSSFGLGAFNSIASFRGNAFCPGSMDYIGELKFDASRSSSIYGNSITVQPPSITLIPQIKY